MRLKTFEVKTIKMSYFLLETVNEMHALHCFAIAGNCIERILVFN